MAGILALAMTLFPVPIFTEADFAAPVTTVSVANTAPTISVAYESPTSDNTTPTDVGDNVTIYATGSDVNGDQYWLAVCKGAGITKGTSGGAPTCNTAAWKIATSKQTQAVATSVSFTITSGETLETYDWYAYVCDDNAGDQKCSAADQGSGASGSPFKVNHAPGFTGSSNDGAKNPGAQQTVTVSSGQYSDGDSSGSQDQVKLYVCPSQAFTDGASPHCDATELCSSSLTTPGNPITCNFNLANPVSHGTKHYYPYVVDTHGLMSGGAGQGEDKTYSANDIRPTFASTPTLNGGSAIGLTHEKTTNNIDVIGTATDDNGCGDLVASNTYADVWQTSLTRTGCDSGGEASGNNCYYHVTCALDTATNDCTGGSDKDAGFKCTVAFQYYANPTDTYSPWSTDSWTATFIPGDEQTLNGTGEKNSNTVVMNSYLAIGLADSPYNAIAYGSVAAGAHTTPNLLDLTHMKATGNVSIDASISGDPMTGPGTSIPANKQKYGIGASAPLWGAGGNAVLSGTPTLTALHTCKSGYTQTPGWKSVYWGIDIPAGQVAGDYTGSNTITAVENNWSGSGSWCE